MKTGDINKVSKAVIVNSRGKVLLLHPMSKEKWHLPGGHLQQQETYLAGLKREVFEETHLHVTFFVLLDARPGFQLWLCKCSPAPVRLSDEHKSHAWLSFNDALTKLPITKETKRDLKIAQEKIKKYANWFTIDTPNQKTPQPKRRAVELQ